MALGSQASYMARGSILAYIFEDALKMWRWSMSAGGWLTGWLSVLNFCVCLVQQHLCLRGDCNSLCGYPIIR